MIIYQANRREFLHQALHDEIRDVMTRHYAAVTARSYTIKRYLNDILTAFGDIKRRPVIDQHNPQLFKIDAQ